MKILQTSERNTLGRNTLRLLCSVLIKPGTRVEFCEMIEPSAFTDLLQCVVFEEVKALGAVESRRLREMLPAKITLRGFPDFDLHEFLAPGEVNEEEIEQLFESAFLLVKLSDSQDNPSIEM